MVRCCDLSRYLYDRSFRSSILCGFKRNVLYGTCSFYGNRWYTSALLTMAFDVPNLFWNTGRYADCSVLWAIVSYPTLKLRDDYYNIVTLGIGEAIKLIIQNATSTLAVQEVWQTYRREAIFVNVWIIVILTVIDFKIIY